MVEVSLPALVTVTKTTYDPRYPTIKSKMAANRAVIEEITNSDPDIERTSPESPTSPKIIV